MRNFLNAKELLKIRETNLEAKNENKCRGKFYIKEV